MNRAGLAVATTPDRDRTAPGSGGDPPEVHLVTQAAAGSREAFEALYRRHVDRIHGLVFRWVGPDEAAEVTQDVFVRAWEKLGTFRGDSAFGTWLHRVAIRVILGQRKTMGKARQRFSADETDLDRSSAPPDTPDHRMDLERGIAALPEGARRVLLLHDVEGYRHEEIGTMLGISPGTSKSQLHRARMALRACLEGMT